MHNGTGLIDLKRSKGSYKFLSPSGLKKIKSLLDSLIAIDMSSLKPNSTVVETPPSSSKRSSWLYPATVVLPLLAFAFLKLQTGSLLGEPGDLSPSHQPVDFDKQPRSSASSVASEFEDDNTFDALRRQYAVACPEHKYQTHIFSTDPLIIYIENFMSYEETRYILNLA